MYKSRRDKLAAMLPDNAIAFVLSGKNVYSVGDEMYPFAIDRNFFYLTGIERSDMMYILVKKDGEAKEMLVIERFDEAMAKWVGPKMLPEEATDISGIADIVMDDEKWSCIHRIMSRQLDHVCNLPVYADLSKQEANQVTPAGEFVKEYTTKYSNTTLNNLAGMLAELRLIKSDVEVENISKAIAVTNTGILNMLDHAKAGIGENELEAHFDFVLKFNNCKHAFPTIVGSGKNGTVLHYSKNNQIAEDNTLVLCDLGAAYGNYSADITRTFPVNGKFTERQKQIYNIVLEANEMIISAVKPGLTLRDLNDMVIAFYEEKLNEIGLLQNEKTVADYYWHSVSHMLGLETHDVQLSDYKIQPGNVLTVEPGLYLEDEGIGIRIEDDVLVTECGCINLSEEIMKTVEQIENYML